MKSKIFTVILLIVLMVVVGFFVFNKKVSTMVSPVLKQDTNKQTTSAPPVSSYNPPVEIQYDSATDLKQELESVNPQVLDSDFSE